MRKAWLAALLATRVWASDHTPADREAFAAEVQVFLTPRFSDVEVEATGKAKTTLSFDTGQCNQGLLQRLVKAMRDDAAKQGFKHLECWSRFWEDNRQRIGQDL